MNLWKVKGKMTEKQKTYRQCAKAIGVSDTTFYKKINGKTKFYYDEAIALFDYLDMNAAERNAVLFE